MSLHKYNVMPNNHYRVMIRSLQDLPLSHDIDKVSVYAKASELGAILDALNPLPPHVKGFKVVITEHGVADEYVLSHPIWHGLGEILNGLEVCLLATHLEYPSWHRAVGRINANVILGQGLTTTYTGYIGTGMAIGRGNSSSR